MRLAVDVGTVRIGLAYSDPSGLLASALETVPRSWTPDQQEASADLRRLVELASHYQPIEWVVGLPLALSGRETASTADARAFAEALSGLVNAPVRLLDERLSTVSASSQLRASGKGSRRQRSVIDQVAAVILLQHLLDAERSGHLPGVLLTPPHPDRNSS